MKAVLHITNDYSGSTVYMNLIRELDNLGVEQIVYNPIRNKKGIGKNSIKFKNSSSRIIYRSILNYHIDRFFYPWKRQKILKDIQKQVDFTKIDFIHAHTWYSDGGVAYELSKKYNIPFIVAIRSTDINLFQRKLKYLRPYGRRILREAQKVILISASYKEKVFSQNSLKSILSQLKLKTLIIPNGVDPFWIEKAVEKKKFESKEKLNILYLGTFIKRKKVLILQNAVLELSKKHDNIQFHLHLVGGGGKDETEILKKVEQYPQIYTYHGKVYDKEKLKFIFQSCDIFAMPSINETFGLVYIEALLQGLFVLYTKDEGIDSFYQERIGEKVNKQSDEIEIQDALLKMIKNYNNYQIPTRKLIKNHDWKLIARKYKEIYCK